MFCGNCGNQLKDEAEFCPKCGHKVNLNNISGIKGPGDAFLPNNTNTNGAVSNYQQNPTHKSHKGLIIGLSIGIGVLVIAIVVLLAYLFFLKPQSNDISKYENNKSNATSLNMSISQIDTSAFPEVTIYTSIKDSADKKVSSLNASDFKIVEFGSDKQEYTTVCKTLESLKDSDELDVNLVIDQSSSMDEHGKISEAKSAANSFIDELTKRSTSNLEITSFDDKVYNKQPFTNNSTLLHSSVNSIKTYGNTALYDAIYWSIQRTSLRSGSRFVVAFTDGEENRSKYKENEVIELSKKTGIPVYIIGVGDSINRSSLQNLANKCKGQYYDCSVSNMSSTLSNIYTNIYKYTEDLYRLIFVSQCQDNLYQYRDINVICNDDSNFSGHCETTYSPKNDISLYDNKAVNADYVLPESNSRYYSEAELQKMSIWDLYLARNEIYARHGRDFKHRDLQEYFATKTWYHKTYTPEQFDAIQSQVFNDFERKNADLMLQIERSRNSPYLAP